MWIWHKTQQLFQWKANQQPTVWHIWTPSPVGHQCLPDTQLPSSLLLEEIPTVAWRTFTEEYLDTGSPRHHSHRDGVRRASTWTGPWCYCSFCSSWGDPCSSPTGFQTNVHVHHTPPTPSQDTSSVPRGTQEMLTPHWKLKRKMLDNIKRLSYTSLNIYLF